LTAAGVVLLVQQILKLKIVPIAFANRYPVPTNIILSVIATFFLVPVKWSLDNIPALLLQVGTVAVVAAIAFNQLLAKWSQLREVEGDGK
jgi:hypothetical protein